METSIASAPKCFERRTTELNPSVLIISSEEESLQVYKKLLDIWKYRAKTFYSVEEMIFNKISNSPFIILMELEFPFEKGLKNLSKIRKSFENLKIPIISVSSFAQPEYKNMALSAGADEYLVKPLDFDLLKNSLNSVSSFVMPEIFSKI